MQIPKLPLKLPSFKKKQEKKTKIGLDWGFSSFKVVILEPQEQDNRYLLKDARIIEISSKDKDKEFNLSSLTKDLDLSGGVNLGICGPNVVVRYVSMAKMSQTDFKNSLRYEAASHLPFPVEQLMLDGVILKDLPDNQMLVMLAAAKKNFINQRLKLFQEANIRVNILDIDSLALINAFNYTHAQPTTNVSSTATGEHSNSKVSNKDAHTQENNILSGAVALVNIGASLANINVLEDGVPHFSRDINVKGRDFTQQASREVAIANFVTEIRKSFDYYEAGSTTVINKIFLSGGGSLVSGFASKLGDVLDMQIEQWNPFSNFEFTSGLDEEKIRKNSGQFAVAVGLALR